MTLLEIAKAYVNEHEACTEAELQAHIESIKPDVNFRAALTTLKTMQRTGEVTQAEEKVKHNGRLCMVYVKTKPMPAGILFMQDLAIKMAAKRHHAYI